MKLCDYSRKTDGDELHGKVRRDIVNLRGLRDGGIGMVNTLHQVVGYLRKVSVYLKSYIYAKSNNNLFYPMLNVNR